VDPLGLDEWFRGGLPLARRDVGESLRQLHRIAAAPLEVPDARAALAALRDLDFLLCHAHRLAPGVWPRIPRLEALLLRLGKLGDHIPRGANDTYGIGNEDPPDTRTFTRTPQEHALYRGLALGESRLDDLLVALVACLLNPVDSAAHVDAARALAAGWEPMIEGVKLMRRAVVAPVMGGQIAPWVSATFTIGGRGFRGPTAAQLPVVLVDWLLWGVDADDEVYREYYRYYAAEQPTYRRRMVAAALGCSGGRGLLRKLAHELPRARDHRAAAASLDALGDLLRRMHGFRVAHANLAKPSLPIRAKGADSWGTGEFDPEMLDRLLAHTIRARRQIDLVRERLQEQVVT
jgi:hypothetical protein